MKPIILHLPDEAQTSQLGEVLSTFILPGQVLYFHGALGAGKTTLIRALLKKLGVQGPVKSPSYSLVEVHVVSRLYLYHFDFFRFTDPQEWEDSGFRDYFNNQSVCLVEWPEKAMPLLPIADLNVTLEIIEGGRRIKMEAGTQNGAEWLAAADFSSLLQYREN